MLKSSSHLNNKKYINRAEEKLLCNFLIGFHNAEIDKFMDLNTGKFQHLHRFADNNLAKMKSINLIFEDEKAEKQAWLHLICDMELISKETIKLIARINKIAIIK